MKIWLLGARGQLGRALIDQCHSEGIRLVAMARQDLDITDLEAVKRAADAVHATHVINCAAFTDVDEAEKREWEAYAVNALGPENLGMVCRERGMRMIHVSTDNVFDGQASSPYTERDKPNPINVYGKSKLEGEERLFDQMPTACIVRTSWVFGMSGKNFISSIFDKILRYSHIDADADQKRRATYNRDLARALLDLVSHSGIFHFANGKEVSRYDILKDFFQLAKQQNIPIKCKTIAPSPSSLPLYSVLDTQKVSRVLGRKPRMWENVRDDYFKLIAPIA